jgi:soluble lytic murein transglycosylase
MSKTALATLTVLTGILATASWAAPLPSGPIPLPTPRPEAEVPGIQAPAAPVTPAMNALDVGLEALGDGNASLARRIRDMLPRSTLDRHILTWAIALSGLEDVPSGEISEAALELKGWPGLSALPRLLENALFHEDPPAQKVLSVFAGRQPETARGAILLIRALVTTGDTKRARALASESWRTVSMNDRDAGLFLSEFDSLLTKADHFRRMEMLLYRDQVRDAGKLSSRAEAQSLYRAWAAVIRTPAKAAGAIKAVDRSWHQTPAYLYLRIRHLRELEKKQGSRSASGENATRSRGPGRSGRMVGGSPHRQPWSL